MTKTSKYQYIFIDESNQLDFDTLLPRGFATEENRVCIGIADESDMLLGTISYSLIRFEYVIDWIYVEPTAREHGVGTCLLDKVIETVIATGDLFPITARFPYTESTYSVFCLFQSNENMMLSYSHERFLISAEEIRKAESLHVRLSIQSTLFFDLPEEQQKAILFEMEYKHGYVIDSYERWKRSMIPAFCRCIFADGELVDLVLIKRLLNGDLEVSFAYSKKGIGLMAIFATVTAEAEEKYPGASLTFDSMNEKGEQLAKKLFPDATSIPIYEAVYL